MSKKFTYEELATILGVSRQTLYNWKNNGKIPDGDIDAPIVEKLLEEMESEAMAEVRHARNRFRVLETERLVAV